MKLVDHQVIGGIAGIANIFYWIGIASSQMGTVPKCNQSIPGIELPILIGLVMAVPFVLGFLTGIPVKEGEKE